MVYILYYDEYDDVVAYKILEVPRKPDVVDVREKVAVDIYNKQFKGHVLYAPKHHFLRDWVFSH